MEFVCIEAKAFMEMNEALEAVEKKIREVKVVGKRMSSNGIRCHQMSETALFGEAK